MNQLQKLRLKLQDRFRHYSQTHHYYDGPYHGGQSFYSYYLDDEGMRVFDGPFRYQLSSISPYGKAFRNEAEGSFLNGLKDGKWHYFFKSDTHRMKLTVDYVKGNIDGYLYYEEYNANMVQNKASKTKISFRSSKRRLIGEVVGLFQGHKFKARLDADGLMTSGRRPSMTRNTVNGRLSRCGIMVVWRRLSVVSLPMAEKRLSHPICVRN